MIAKYRVLKVAKHFFCNASSYMSLVNYRYNSAEKNYLCEACPTVMCVTQLFKSSCSSRKGIKWLPSKNCALLGYYAACSGNSLPIFRDNISVPSSRVKNGTERCPETSVINYHYTLRNVPEEQSSHLLRDGSLKSRTANWFQEIMCISEFSSTSRRKSEITDCQLVPRNNVHLTPCNKTKLIIPCIFRIYSRITHYLGIEGLFLKKIKYISN